MSIIRFIHCVFLYGGHNPGEPQPKVKKAERFSLRGLTFARVAGRVVNETFCTFCGLKLWEA